jgi:transcription initiation factor TFIID subunit TAF12
LCGFNKKTEKKKLNKKMDQLQPEQPQQQQQQQKKAKNKRNRNVDLLSSAEIPRVRRKTKGQDMAPKNRKKKAHGK